MLYMKFLNPIVAPFIQPTINRILSYFRAPQIVTESESCPIRKPTSSVKKDETTGGDQAQSKSKDD